MAKLQSTTISRRTVETIRAGKDTVYWDSALPGFGLRVYPSGAKMYIVQMRARGKSTRVTVGRHGVLTPEEACRRAALIIARVKAGEDPVPVPLAAPPEPGPTVAELAQRYRAEHLEVRCKPGTVKAARAAIERHILPALGALPLTAVDRDKATALHGGLSETPAMANLAVDVISRMFVMAQAWGMAPDGTDPCRGIVRYRMRKRERFLTDGEFRRLGRELGAAVAEGTVSVHAGAAIRLLMLTGCRRNEILTLRWEDVDMEACEFRLRDNKTGPRVVSLAPAPVKVLAALPRAPRRCNSSRPRYRATGLRGFVTMLAQASGTCSPVSPHCRAAASMARRISKARLAAPVLSTLAASNHAETRAWSMASSLSLPNCGISRLRR